jgi:hypothetical protein
MSEVSTVEKPPTMEGRFMNMILGPISNKSGGAQQKQSKGEPKVATSN